MSSIKAILQQKFFPFVVKPGRYAGGEIGQITKDSDSRTSYLHCYPDKYEIGHSYTGLQILYHLVNQDDRFICERAFAVDKDAEEILRKENIPLFSLETWKPIREFSAIGFTLVDETVYTNMLNIIDLGGIPIRRDNRSDNDPLVLAGGPAVFNPEPIAEFVDVIYIGDGEEGLLEILGVIHEMKNAPRNKKLHAIAQRVDSVYVPMLYDKHGKPIDEAFPKKIKARVVKELKPQYYPHQPIIPLIETVHNHLGIEIMRGCPQGCRFCMAGTIYRPVRVRNKNDILQQIEIQLNNSGYDEVSLMSLSATDYPELEELTTAVAKKLEAQRVSIALPSLRPGSVSPALFNAVKRVRKSGLTIAPEAGTERLRLFIRKDFPDAAIYDTARLAFEHGWLTIKLYFMIGLPTETDDDLIGIANMCRTVAQIGNEFPGKKTVNVTLSPFIPKPHTPFQWDGMISKELFEERIHLIKRNTRHSQVNFKINQPDISILTAILGRGGREMGDVIETAFKNGCRFEGWGENFNFDAWLTALAQHGHIPDSLLKPIPFSVNLPWSHIDKGISIEHFIEERQRTSLQLKEYIPVKSTNEEPETESDNGMEFGRSKKKVVSRNVAPPTKNRIRIRWGKTTRYRYMSHLENLHLIERTIRRARLPVAYSQGFNPTMKLSFGPPLPLGFTSETEFVDITLEVSFLSYMIDNLRKKFPDGIMIYDARIVQGKNASLSSALNRVVYSVPTDCWDDEQQLGESVEKLLSMTELPIDRYNKSGVKRVDIRPAIFELKFEGGHLFMHLGLGDAGYARPDEVAALLKGGLHFPPNGMPFHRCEMYRIDADNQKIDAMEL